MRALVIGGLLCTLLLCSSVFSVEGRRHPRPPAKPWKGKPCCSQVPDPALRTQKGDRGLTFSASHLLHLLATSLLAGVSVTVEAASQATATATVEPVGWPRVPSTCLLYLGRKCERAQDGGDTV
ncbi:protein GPR15LG isoform X2 [Myotis daubentonii]|uniref:protein GPR15LG isoform X2 n=1 Tax=Myotis daubentonii TaxID=98922 RepID=UPI002873B409|nr:protein GPR15LG isoform X2 [Myotis daubentonii]